MIDLVHPRIAAEEPHPKGFSHEAKEQRARLATIGIFEGGEAGHTCPLCAQDLPKEHAPPQVAALQGSLTDVASRMESVARVEPHLENAISVLEVRLQEVQQSLTRNRTQMEAVRTANTALSEAHTDSAKKAHVLGRVSLYLESMPDVPDTKELEGQAESLRAKCRQLEEELSDERVLSDSYISPWTTVTSPHPEARRSPAAMAREGGPSRGADDGCAGEKADGRDDQARRDRPRGDARRDGPKDRAEVREKRLAAV